MQTAATGGTSGSKLGRRAFWQSEATLPGVSLPSSVVRSTMETAVLSPQSLELFLMLRVWNLATRSSIPTWSTVPLPSSSLLKLVRKVAVAGMVILIPRRESAITTPGCLSAAQLPTQRHERLLWRYG